MQQRRRLRWGLTTWLRWAMQQAAVLTLLHMWWPLLRVLPQAAALQVPVLLLLLLLLLLWVLLEFLQAQMLS